MVKSKIACAASVMAMTLGSGILASVAFADAMPTTCEGIDNCAEIDSAEDLASFFVDTGQEARGGNNFMTREGNSTMIISGDFTMKADYYVKDANLSIYLGDHTVTMNDYSFLFYDSSVNIYGGSGSLTNADAYYAPLYLRSGANVVINGGTISGGQSEDNVYDPEPAVYLEDGAKLTLNDGVLTAKTWAVDAFAGTEFTMEGGKVIATGQGSIAIAGNGTADPENPNYGGNAIFTINGGTIESGELGIYAPQVNGTTTIAGGEIKALTGVEVRAGTLNISGGSFLVDGEAVYEISSNGNGSTTTGAAVAVAQHTTKQPIDVNITGGVFIAPVVFSEANPQNNSAEDIAKINLNIAGGVFSGSVVSEDFERESFITGGDFVDMTAATDGTEVVINGAVVSDGVKKLEVSEVEKNTLALFGGGTLVLARDIKLTDKDGEVKVETSDGVNLIVSLAISDEEYAALMDYDKVQVVYFDDESKEANRIDAELKGNSTDGYYVEFTTTHLSTYGVVGVNESEEESEAEAVAETDSPETGTMTAAGASASVAAMAAAVTVGVLTSIVSFAYLMRRKD